MAVPVLVDSNVLIDVFTEDQRWFDWSATALASAADRSLVAINPIIDAEVSIGFERIEEVEAALRHHAFERLDLPPEAAFLAGKVFVRYRRPGGTKNTTLPDVIGRWRPALSTTSAGLRLLASAPRPRPQQPPDRDELPHVVRGVVERY